MDKNQLKRAEKGIISSVILNSGFLKKLPMDFNADMLIDETHRKIYEWCVDFYYNKGGKEVDLYDLYKYLAVSPSLIAELIQVFWEDIYYLNFEQQFDYWLKEARKIYLKKKISELPEIDDQGVSFFDRVEQLKTELEEYSKDEGVDVTPVSDMQICEKLVEDIEEGKEAEFFTTGLTELDDKYQIRRQELTVIGASTSIGKSAFALFFSCNMSRKDTVFYFSTEMGEEDQSIRSLAHKVSINSERIRRRRLTHDEIKQTREVLKENKNHLYWDCQTRKVPEIEKRMKNITPDVVVVDHLQDLFYDKKRSREEGVGENIRLMKSLAIKHNCAFIVLSQLSRQAEGAEKLTLAMLRESGIIEMVADGVIFIQRDRENEPNKADFKITKNRHGIAGITISTSCNFGTYDFY